MNTLNNTDLNTSFDHFVKNIKLASNGEVNWSLNDIDTSQFKSKFSYKIITNLKLFAIYFFIIWKFIKDLVENIRTGEKNNWNLNSNEFVNFASSLSNFLAQSGITQKNTNNKIDSNQTIKCENCN